MSSTIGSPARMTRSDASWWGDAELGPEPTIANSAVVVALGDEPLAHLVGDVGLGPPDQPAGGDLGHDPVGRLGRESQQRDLVGVLDHPQVRQDRRCGLEPRRPAGRPAVAAGGWPRACRRRAIRGAA